jgi:hypothetical protein
VAPVQQFGAKNGVASAAICEITVVTSAAISRLVIVAILILILDQS